MNYGPAYGGLIIIAGAAGFFAVVAWVTLYISSVIMDVGSPIARSYPRAGAVSLGAGIAASIIWQVIYVWLKSAGEGAMLASVAVVASALAFTMALLGHRLGLARRELPPL